MNYEEFRDWVMKNPANRIAMFAYTHNIPKGEDIYHSCEYCDFETKKVKSIGLMTSTDGIDIMIIKHVYEKHWQKLSKTVNENIAFEIASAKGQQRLQI